MITPSWQLKTPLNAIIFDCDGTLSSIEGIDQLAKNNGTYETVRDLTATAMGKSGINPAIYEKRLSLVLPTKNQVTALGQEYFSHCTPFSYPVVQILKRLQKTVYIISAGLFPAVRIFGNYLTIPEENIFAVQVQFDKKGNFLDFDRSSSLTSSHGKRIVVSELKKKHPEILHIGDGLNDYAVHDLVSRFVGFGGSYFRGNIANLCKYYIATFSMAPLLPLSLTARECENLLPEEKHIYQQGMDAILSHKVILSEGDN